MTSTSGLAGSVGLQLVADADCPMCEAMGYRSCDACGGPAWAEKNSMGLSNLFIVDGRELCGYCAPPQSL